MGAPLCHSKPHPKHERTQSCLLLLAGSVFSQETTESSSSSEDVAVTTVSSASTTNDATSTTEAPVVIVKQVNEINEDGTYTVGYEASDGSFKLETKDADGNVKGKYGVVDENGDIKIVEYSANNSTGFTSDLELPEVHAVELETPVQQADPAFELEKQRHEAVLAFQKAVIEKQQRIAAQNDASAQRQAFANNRQQQGARRPVFNAANFNPSRPASEQFNTQNFNQDFRDFQQNQQFAQNSQQFAQQRPQQQQFRQQQPSQFQQQFQQNQQFAQNPQQFAQQRPQQFAPQQQQQFAPQQQAPQQIPVSQLTREQIALEGFSRDDDQDGQIDALPAHLLPQQPQQPAFQQQSQQQFGLQRQQQFAPQQPAFQQQPQQQFASRPPPAFQQQPAQQPSFRTPQPVGPSQVPQQQFSQAQLQQLFSQQQQG